MRGLFRDDALAFTDSYAEFQEDHTIVRVDFPDDGQRGTWLGRASMAFDAIWNDVPKMIAFARIHLRRLEPTYWRRLDAAGISGTALIAFCIWIDPVDGTSCCQVSFDAALDLPPGIEELSENDAAMVTRSESGWLSIAGVPPPHLVMISFPASAAPPQRLPLRCPCCRCKTLSKRAIYAICPVCYWEDDGQDDDDADVVYGGPNYELSLTQGQANYREFGASRRKDLPHVRAPRAEELPDADEE
jgi:hypothetical protein